MQLLDMVENNEINRSLLALLDENIANAHKGNQVGERFQNVFPFVNLQVELPILRQNNPRNTRLYCKQYGRTLLEHFEAT